MTSGMADTVKVLPLQAWVDAIRDCYAYFFGTRDVTTTATIM